MTSSNIFVCFSLILVNTHFNIAIVADNSLYGKSSFFFLACNVFTIPLLRACEIKNRAQNAEYGGWLLGARVEKMALDIDILFVERLTI